ncbi:MAG: hypothetical protein ACQESB_01280 [Elusimicrobiota bacterium]
MGKEKDQIPFIIALSFLSALLFIRLGVFLAGSAQTDFARVAKVGDLPEVRFYLGRNIILFGYHIHHFYIGILLICLAGWLSITRSFILSRKQLAAMYGAGLGLFFDEIGLLLTWGDYYSHLTYVMSLFMIAIFVNMIYFSSFWSSVKDNFDRKPPSSKFFRAFFRHNSFIKAADFISEKTGNSPKTSLIFTGIVYLLFSFIVIKNPRLVRYIVAFIFFLNGISYLLRLSNAGEEGENYDI